MPQIKIIINVLPKVHRLGTNPTLRSTPSTVLGLRQLRPLHHLRPHPPILPPSRWREPRLLQSRALHRRRPRPTCMANLAPMSNSKQVIRWIQSVLHRGTAVHTTLRVKMGKNTLLLIKKLKGRAVPLGGEWLLSRLFLRHL